MSNEPTQSTTEESSFDDQLEELRRVAVAKGAAIGAARTAPSRVSNLIDIGQAAAARAGRDPAAREREAESLRRDALRRASTPVVPVRYAWASFDSPDLVGRVSSKTAIARARLALRASIVVLTGASGFGKTSLAAAMLRARMELEGWDSRHVLFAETWELERARAGHPLGEDEAPLVERAMARRLVVVDDVGSEKSAPLPAVPDVINVRYSSGRPIWVTTWMTSKQVAARYGEGIARRLFEDGNGVFHIDCGAGAK